MDTIMDFLTTLTRFLTDQLNAKTSMGGRNLVTGNQTRVLARPSKDHCYGWRNGPAAITADRPRKSYKRHHTGEFVEEANRPAIYHELDPQVEDQIQVSDGGNLYNGLGATGTSKMARVEYGGYGTTDAGNTGPNRAIFGRTMHMDGNLGLPGLGELYGGGGIIEANNTSLGFTRASDDTTMRGDEHLELIGDVGELYRGYGNTRASNTDSGRWGG